MKKILGFAGSNSSTSINRRLVRFTLSQFDNWSVTLLDLNDFEMPIFSVDREKKGIPDEAGKFLEIISEHDALVVSMAEHNRSYTVAFKNIFDWCSRIDINIFQQKPMLLMSTSPGRYAGGRVMETAKSHFPEFGARIIETFSLPRFYKNFSEENVIGDTALREGYQEALAALLLSLETQ